MKINKKFALQLPKQDFYSFKLCTKKGLRSRPVEVGTNIVSKWMEALLVTGPTRPSSLNPPLPIATNVAMWRGLCVSVCGHTGELGKNG